MDELKRCAQCVLSALIAAGFVVLSGVGIAMSWKISIENVKRRGPPSIVVQYEDIDGRQQTINVPRQGNEGAPAHRERAVEFVHTMEVAFPRKK